MSERQRVRGTAVGSYFCEPSGNLVSNKVMPPFTQRLVAIEMPRFIAVRTYKLGYRKKKRPDREKLDQGCFYYA